MMMNGARILVEELIRQGVEVIFGYPGGSVLNIYDELYLASDRIRHVLSAHEQGAAHAADGYARASGKTGVVLATSGPGATNLVTGIANAYFQVYGAVINGEIVRQPFAVVRQPPSIVDVNSAGGVALVKRGVFNVRRI